MLDRELLERAGVSEKDAGELGQAWDAYQAANAQKTKRIPHVVCTGIYNAGKSTLLNALMGEDRFSTGDIPTTKVVAQAEFGGAVYIDTPGLNAKEEDDRETQAAYKTADFILFVSSAQNGGISAAEAEWLQKLRNCYTTDSLKRRLIFAVSHCGQVEEDTLPSIRAQFIGDLERALGFAPEAIFCVDSISYQDGLEQNSAPLKEYSGIPILKKALAEQITKAEALLQQAQKAEVDARWSELLNCLGKVKAAVKGRYDAAAQKQQAQIAEIDAAWKEFEKNLEEEMSKHKSGPKAHVWLRPVNHPSGYSRRDTSETGARWAAESAMDSFYERGLSSRLNNEIERCIHELRGYSSTGLDSVYSKWCNAINQVFEQGILCLAKLGVKSCDTEEISISPASTLVSYIEYSLKWDLWSETALRKKLRAYIDEVSVMRDWEFDKKGLFGIRHDVTYYYYDLHSISCNMIDDVQNNVDKNAEQANSKMDEYWQDYYAEVSSEVQKRKRVLKKQVDTYCASLEQLSGSDETTAALAYLDRLETEVSK